MMVLISVDLPAPLSPSRPTICLAKLEVDAVECGNGAEVLVRRSEFEHRVYRESRTARCGNPC